jgi:hypothetical protein
MNMNTQGRREELKIGYGRPRSIRDEVVGHECRKVGYLKKGP